MSILDKYNTERDEAIMPLSLKSLVEIISQDPELHDELLEICREIVYNENTKLPLKLIKQWSE